MIQSNEMEVFETYDKLMNEYVETIVKLLDVAKDFGILPFKVTLGMGYIKNYIRENRFEVLTNGLSLLLENKDVVLNFDTSKLDELDNDDDDNVSIKSCVNSYKKQSGGRENIDMLKGSDEMLDIIIDIKNRSKNMDEEQVGIVKVYFEILIMLLEQIKGLF